MAEMVSHEFISETLEHTRFADGTEVYANFGAEEASGVPGKGFVIKH